MKQYGNEVIDAIAERLTQFKGRMLFFAERQEVAREMVAKNLFNAKQLIETVNLILADKQNTLGWPFSYECFCVDWISQTEDPAQSLLTIAFDVKLGWHVRQEAFECIGALPSKDSLTEDEWRKVASAICSEHDCTEFRDRAFWSTVDQGVTSVLPILKRMLETQLQNQTAASPEEKRENQYEWSNATRRLKLGVAALGDNGLVAFMIEQIFSNHQYHEREAKRAFKQVVNRLGGIKEVAAELLRLESIEFTDKDVWSPIAQHSNPAVVRWAMLQMPFEHDSYDTTLLSQLSNSDWGIREEACNLIYRSQDRNPDFNQNPVWDLLNDETNDRVTRSWAARTLLKLGNSIDEILPPASREKTRALWYVPWPFEFDAVVRQAAVANYGMHYQPGTDIRYKLESAMYEPYKEENANADRESLVAELGSNGIEVTKVQSADERYAQGWGTYWSIQLGDALDSSEIFVSTLGPIASYVEVNRYKTEKSSGSSWAIGRKADDFDKEAQKTEKQRVEVIAKQVGFAVVEKDLLDQVPPGLNIRFFSELGPQPISDLIYFWVS